MPVFAWTAPRAGGRRSRSLSVPLRPATARAATKYGLSPFLLRALHQVESSGVGDGCLANLQGSGATGPLQFMPATFRAYGVDGDGDGSAGGDRAVRRSRLALVSSCPPDHSRF